MRDYVPHIPYDAAQIIRQAVGPDPHYCMGYMNPGAPDGRGYISTMKLSVGTVNVKNLDQVTENIVSYDRCEKNDAYIGQINMLTVSSFCGQNGAVWGYDLAVHEDIANKTEKPMYMQSQPDGPDIPVYNVKPLLEAAERLFGRENERRFPPMPGAHVICANKDATARGPLWVWASIGIAILKDRSKGSCLFIEDANTYGDANTTEEEVKAYLDGTLRKVTNSIALCGQDQSVVYDRIYTGYKYLFVKENQVGCSLTCAPYVYLAQNAIPAGMKPEDLKGMPINEWEKLLNLEPLSKID